MIVIITERINFSRFDLVVRELLFSFPMLYQQKYTHNNTHTESVS